MTAVKVYATAGSISRTKRQALEQIHGGGQVREAIGLNLATKKIEFSLLSTATPRTNKWAEAAYIQGVLESEDEFTLKSPDGTTLAGYGLQAGQFSMRDWTQTDSTGHGKITLVADCIYMGALPRDGGTYTPVESWQELFL